MLTLSNDKKNRRNLKNVEFYSSHLKVKERTAITDCLTCDNRSISHSTNHLKTVFKY